LRPFVVTAATGAAFIAGLYLPLPAPDAPDPQEARSPRLSGLGSLSFPIATTSPDALFFFDQGLRLRLCRRHRQSLCGAQGRCTRRDDLCRSRHEHPQRSPGAAGGTRPDGVALSRAGRLPQAAETLRQALIEAPSSGYALHALREVSTALGDELGAREYGKLFDTARSGAKLPELDRL
jgi:hypothetical protein